MSVTHRLGDEWIMSYAAGSLSEGVALVVASHLSYLPDAPANLALAEATGGALLENLTPETMKADALARTLARLDEPGGELVERAPKPAPATNGILPAPLRNWLGCDVDDLDWSFLGPGLRKIMLWRGPDDERLWMLRARPGARIPDHGHHGTELVLVLKGSFSDQNGRFEAGDIEESDASDNHGLTIGTEDECICLALTHGPVRFGGIIARLMQPFLGL